MSKSIILAAAIAAVALTQAPSVEARGLRVGIGFGSGGPSPLADPTILHGADRIKERQAQRRQAAAAARERQHQATAARESQRQAAQAAEAKRREAAAEAAEARRREAAAKAKRPVETARPNVAALPTPAAPLAGGDRTLESAQDEQRAKAEQLLKSLGRPAPTPTAAPAPAVAPPPAAVGPVSPAEPAPVQVVPVVVPSTAPAKAPASGECRRFIPGAGITVKVPCSE